MKRVLLLVLFALTFGSLAATNQPVLAASHLQGGSVSNSFGDPGDAYLEFTLSGADFIETRANFYEGKYAGGAITLSGRAIVTRAEGISSWMIVTARIGEQSANYPPSGDEGLISGESFEFPFNLSFTVPPDYPSTYINGSVRLDVCGEWSCGTYEVGFQVNIPEPAALPASNLDQTPDQLSNSVDNDSGNTDIGNSSGGSSIGLPMVVVLVLVVGAGGVVLAGGVITITSIALKKPPALPKAPADPESAQAAEQADLEADAVIRQWESVRASGDPSDPEYKALEQKYQDYIDDQRRQAVEARRQAQEIEAQEQQYQQEVRQQQAYRQHRQAEADFIQQESQRQIRRAGAFDRQMDQLVRTNQQKMEQLKIKQKQDRLRRQRDLIEGRMNVDQAEANMYLSFGQGANVVVTGLEYIKATADFAIDVGADIIPGAGKMIQGVYKVGAGMGEGVGEAMQDPDHWAAHLAKGTAKGLLDLGADKLKGGLVNGLPPQIRNHVIFRGAKINHDPARMSTFLEASGRRAAIQRGIFNTGLSRITDQANPVIWGRDGLKNLIGR
jgi:hypothetical protein